jgi:hypothetical protein
MRDLSIMSRPMAPPDGVAQRVLDKLSCMHTNPENGKFKLPDASAPCLRLDCDASYAWELVAGCGFGHTPTLSQTLWARSRREPANFPLFVFRQKRLN